MPDFKPQTENLFRGLPGGVELRNASEDLADTTMFGHFAVFNEWTEIASWYEGDFMERIAPGSFKATMKRDIASMRTQYDHGYDTFVGSSVLGPIDVLREDDEGAYYEVPLLDTDYNRERVLPMLQGRTMDGQMRGSVLGASFRFRVVKDEWNNEPKASDLNPKALPERTILLTRTFEFGAVVFGAYDKATSAVGTGGRMRSLSDRYLDLARSRTGSRTAPDYIPAEHTTPESDEGPTSGPPESVSARATALALNTLHQLRRAS